MGLKRWTAQNIVIGGAAGALPPVVAWVAATGSLSVEPLLLFLIIFFWTPPHFWALALFRTDDYARAGVPMLPVVAGPDATRLQILLYTIVLVAVAVAPWPLGYFDAVYGVPRWCSAPACWRVRSMSTAAASGAQALRATRKTVRLLDPLSVRAVCDPADRGRGPRRRAAGLVGGAWRRQWTDRAGARWNRPHRGAKEKPPAALDRHCARARRSRGAVFRGHAGQGAGRARAADVTAMMMDNEPTRCRNRRPHSRKPARAAASAAMRWWLRSAVSSWC